MNRLMSRRDALRGIAAAAAACALPTLAVATAASSPTLHDAKLYFLRAALEASEDGRPEDCRCLLSEAVKLMDPDEIDIMLRIIKDVSSRPAGRLGAG